MLVSLTVGKVDAGVAVLLTEDKRHIEFPSILLPSSISSGSIVDITVKQNHAAEEKAQNDFETLQERILSTYGLSAPATPELRLRNATQTSLVLEWDPIQLATSTLRSLALYRNGSKAGNIPRPMEMTSTKISGLAVDTEYSFYLVLRTSGGTYTSNNLVVKTQKMTDLTGITITPGVLPAQLRGSLETAVQRIKCKLVDTIRIDTTHFVCTEGRGKDWEKAMEMNIPVVRPEWLEGCEREGKIVGVRDYYLGANPKHRQVGSNPALAGQPESTASPADVAAVAAADAQNLPVRSNAPNTPRSPTGQDDGEPGPEVPPTPPPKDKSPLGVRKAGSDSEDEANSEEEEEEEDDNDEEDDDAATVQQDETATSTAKIQDEESDKAPTEEEDDDDDDQGKKEGKLQASDTNKQDGNEMEEVAL